MNSENNQNGFKITEIGLLPEEWDVVKLENLISKTESVDPQKKSDATFKYIDVSSINREFLKISDYKFYIGKNAPSRARKLVKNGDIIFATVRPTLRRLAIVEKDFEGEICSTAFCVLRTKENLLYSKFLFYVLSRNQFIDELGKIQRGASYPAVTDRNVKSQKIPLPPLSEQKKIAAVLSAVQEAREKTEAVIAAAKELKKSLMKYLFTYGPVPVTEAEKVRLKETEIGVVPEEWEIRTVQESVDSIEYGLSLSIPENEDANGIPILSTAEITKDGQILYNRIRKIKIKRQLTDRLLLKHGDVMFNWRNSLELIGKTAIFETNRIINVTYASFVLRIRCDEIKTHNHFLKYLFNYYREKGVFLKLARRAVNQANYNKNEIFVLKIPIPSLEIQKQIAINIKIIDAKIEQEQSKKKSLDQLSKSLLNNLMTGKIRVKHLDIE